jgi:hypothetical protein
MKKSEKVLLGVFAALFLALVGGGGGMMAFKNYMAIREENDTLRDRLGTMNLAVSQGAEWADKHGWLRKTAPPSPAARRLPRSCSNPSPARPKKSGSASAGRNSSKPPACSAPMACRWRRISATSITPP